MFPSGRKIPAWILGSMGFFCLTCWAQEPLQPGDDLEDLVEALEEAGTGPTTGELKAWQEDLTGGVSTLAQDRPDLPGALGTRFSWGASGMLGTRVTWQQKAGPLEARLRFASAGGESRLVGGYLAWRSSSLVLMAGRVGSRFACGLLWAGPGRPSSLAPDHTLGALRQGLRGRTGEPYQRTLEGGGVVWCSEHLEIQAVGGRWPLVTQGNAGPVLALGTRLGWAHTSLGWAASRSPLGWGLSLSGSWERNLLRLEGEAARYYPSDAAGPLAAGLVVATLSPAVRWKVQAAMATSSGAGGWDWGGRPSLLRGDEGQAWACRLQGPLSRHMRLALLAARSDSRALSSAPRREKQTTWDGLVVVRPGAGWEGSGRVLISGKTRHTWDPRFPWQTSAPEPQEQRTLVQLAVGRRSGQREFQAGLRVLDRTTAAGNGRRALWHLRGRWPLVPGVQGRAGYGQAWGDNVDLVSALAPFPGLVIPRHWGSWESETHVGLVWRARTLEFRLAMARRQAAAPDHTSVRWEGWLEGLLRW